MIFRKLPYLRESQTFICMSYSEEASGVKQQARQPGSEILNEPQHICIWNLTDRFYLDGVPRTAQEITDTPALFERLDHDDDGILDFIIDPININCTVEYYDPADSPSGVRHAAWYSLAPGRYGRIIILSDAPVIGSFFYAVSGSFSSIPRNPAGLSNVFFSMKTYGVSKTP